MCTEGQPRRNNDDMTPLL